MQADLGRLRIGVVGAGSVGAITAEALARTGVQNLTLLDFDSVKFINLDRLLHATAKDARAKRAKVRMLGRALRKSATADRFEATESEYSVCEEEGFRAALDCDLLFSCVDRPWPRSVLNFIAYAHLIPVVDGGIQIEVATDKKLRRADWRAHIASPERRCLECLGQYNPADVSLEREGFFDDPNYIAGLSTNHAIRRNENVFPFSLSVAGFEILQMLMMVIAPLGIANAGQQMYHFVPGLLEKHFDPCGPSCIYPTLIAMGDRTNITVTAKHAAAESARRERVRSTPARLRQVIAENLYRVADRFSD